MKKNSILNIIIFILIILIIGVSVYLLIGNNSTPTSTFIFELYGESSVDHNVGEPYFDPGVKLIENNVDKSKEVKVEGIVDTSKEGIYEKIYTYKDHKLTRTINVKKLNSFSLNGESTIYILLNGKYDDPMVEATYKGVDYKDKIEVNGNVDYSKIGTYTINYVFKEINKTLQRKVIVSDFNEYFKINYDTKTSSKEVSITVTIDKNKVSKYLLPSGEEKIDNYEFKINKSGKYKFTIYDKYNNSLEREIEINNINVDPLNVSCVAISKDNKTTLTIKSNKKLDKCVYENKDINCNTNTFDTVIKEFNISITDTDNLNKTINCKTEIIKDLNLEIHFIASGYYDDAILIRDDKNVIFIDGGRSGGAERVIPYLKELGVKKIDLMIGSHAEYDHIQTQASVLDNFEVDKIVYPVNIYKCRSNCNCQRDEDVSQVLGALRRHNKEAIQQEIPSMITIGDMKMYFIAPVKLTCNNNNNSFINILKYGNNTFMFTGDSYSSMNNVPTLLENASKLGLSNIKVDMMKWPHHGNESLPVPFLDAVSPKVIVVPNYKAPQHPSSGRQQVLNGRNIKLYRQSDSTTGNILITSDGNNINYTMNVEASKYKR